MAAPPLTTERLVIRELTLADAPFILVLLNDPSFIRNVGDRGVRTEEDARQYILQGPRASYARQGFGLYLVELAHGGGPIGICGLLKREELPAPDIGFAFLPEFRAKGYAFEAAAAMQAHARDTLGYQELLAIVNPDNQASIRLLEKLGLRFERMFRLKGESRDLKLFASGNIRGDA